MALLWGVMEYLNWRYPVVIDTPLARLDQTSRQLVETHLFSNPPGQLILLLTSAEKVEWGKPKTPSFKLSETFTPLQIEN
jgi:DNA sulfur modification protein DndD